MGQILRRAIMPERIDRAIRFFLYILIFWLPYSPAVIETCVIISLLLWAIKKITLQGAIWRRSDLFFRQKIVNGLKGFRLAPSCLNGPIAFFVAVCALSVINSNFFENAAHNFFTKTIEWFVVYFLVIEAFQEKKHIRIALAVWVFTAFSTVLDGLIQFYFTHKDIFLGHIIDPDGRATAGFKAPNGLGAYLTILVPFLFAALFLNTKKHRYRYLGITIFFLSCWSLMITFSRGAILGTGVGILFCFLVLPPGKEKEKYFFVPGLILAMGLLSICALFILGERVDLGFLTRYRNVAWRLYVWQDSLEMIKDRPILGHGINTFMEIFQSYRRDPRVDPSYAHNCYIQLMTETGILGMFGFLWIVIRLFRVSLQNLMREATTDNNIVILSIGLLSGIMGFLTHSFFDTNFYSLQLSVYLWLMIGILVSLNKISVSPADS